VAQPGKGAADRCQLPSDGVDQKAAPPLPDNARAASAPNLQGTGIAR
jgi:hypothetical protein